ncbi:TPA: hypothetical protein L3G55_002733 [Citrobacter freundii]|nr:hypothetical protein [Citrobacter freundii]
MQSEKGQCGICANCVPQVFGGSGFTNCADAHAAETAGDKILFTKEQLQQIEANAKEVLWPIVWTPLRARKHFEEKITPEVVLTLVGMALAGMEAQPTTVVPDELSEDINDDEYPRAWGYRIGWNACRTAMMNGGVDAQSENESE